MNRELRLEMIEQDIASAVCNSRQHCAIAQTIYRVLQQPIGRVRVTENLVSIAGPDGFRYHYRVPMHAAQLVRDFDKGQSVKPITFVLHYSDRRKIAPLDPAKKQYVNEWKRAQAVALAAAGEKRKAYVRGRFGI